MYLALAVAIMTVYLSVTLKGGALVIALAIVGGGFAPSTRSVILSNSDNTASSTKSVSSSIMNEPCNGFSFFANPNSLLMIN